MVTFPVDDVTPVTDALPTQPFADQFPDALAVGGDAHVLAPDGVHPLLSAVAKAFAEHRPLVLTPDAVWLTIARGIAQHVKLHAEELRQLLVSHDGKKRLEVLIDGPMPTDAQSWVHVVEQFAKQIGDTTFECDFTTSTDVERVAGRVAMMDAYSPYYALWSVCVCGIPSITLTGTVDDWRKIRARVDDLSVLGLSQWRRSLAPIMDEFVRAADSRHDTAFWQRIYNPADAYGGEVVTGWITRFYPYLSSQGTNGEPNPMLDLRLSEPRGHARPYHGPGITTHSVPNTLCRATINIRDLGANRVVALDAGLVGVAQDPSGALRPVAGWALVEAPPDLDDVIDRLIAEHETEPPVEGGLGPSGGGEVIALYHRIGSASLFGGAWRLRPHAERAFVDSGEHTFYGLIDLPDGRRIGELLGGTHWAVLRDGDDPATVPVLGTSLAHLLETAMDSGGDITHLETTRLSEVEPW